MNKRIVTFPHIGNYYIAEKPIARLFGDEILTPPRLTKQTLEIGAKHSPEAVCIPFKYMLGNFIEALEKGANVILLPGAGCRMGLYGEVQKAILRKLGYEFEMVKLINDNNLFKLIRNIKQLNPEHSYLKIVKTLQLAYDMAAAIEEIESVVRKNIGFELKKGSFERLYKVFLSRLDRATTVAQVKEVKEKYLADLSRLAVVKPDAPLRVGIVGEMYAVMEPFSNFFIENELARYGIEIFRYLTVIGIVHHNISYKKYVKKLAMGTAPYLHEGIGGHGTESVAVALDLAKQGFDGLIHVKPFGCMPEVDAMPALYKISRDYKFPILYFSFDSLTSETGIKTRLEAFYDMLEMREATHVAHT